MPSMRLAPTKTGSSEALAADREDRSSARRGSGCRRSDPGSASQRGRSAGSTARTIGAATNWNGRRRLSAPPVDTSTIAMPGSWGGVMAVISGRRLTVGRDASPSTSSWVPSESPSRRRSACPVTTIACRRPSGRSLGDRPVSCRPAAPAAAGWCRAALPSLSSGVGLDRASALSPRRPEGRRNWNVAGLRCWRRRRTVHVRASQPSPPAQIVGPVQHSSAARTVVRRTGHRDRRSRRR